MEYAVNHRTQITKVMNAMFPKTLDELWVEGPKLLNAIQPKFILTDQGYQLAIEMPGIEKENIEVLLDPVNSYLTVKVMDSSNGSTCDCVELEEECRDYPKCQEVKKIVLFNRTVSIPTKADISGGYMAKLDLGILTVTFPVDEATQPRIIEVTVE